MCQLTFLDAQETEIWRFSSKTTQETPTAPVGARPGTGVVAAGGDQDALSQTRADCPLCLP
jgi:hypothetical protein